MLNAGDFAVDQTVYLLFNTYDADGASVTVTDLVAADIKIHKDGGATQRSSASGVTVLIDYDGITGNHLIAIDLSDNTDAGFYSSGADYQVRLEGITVATQTINAWAGVFSIENRFQEVDVVKWLGTAVNEDTAGYPKVTIKDGTGVGEIAITSGKVDGVILADTTTTNTDMVTEPPTAVQNRQEMDSNSTELGKIGTIPVLDGAGQNIGAAIAKLADDNGGADFDATTDSLQAIRDRGDAAWITGGGAGITDIINIQPLIPFSIDLANTATYRFGLMLINSLDDLPSTAEITPGTISIDRKAIGGTSWVSIVSDDAMSEIAGLVYYDEVMNGGTGYAEGDSIRITVKSVKVTVAANDYEIVGATGRIFYTSIRETMRGTNSANTTTPPTVNEVRDGILDDATRFSGANIDAAITSRAVAGDNMNLVADQSAATVGTVTDITNEVGITQAGADKVNGSSGAVIPEITIGAPPATPTPQQYRSTVWAALVNKAVSDTNGSGEWKIYNSSGTVAAKGTLNDAASIFTRGRLVAP